MSISDAELLELTAPEKFRMIELLWDHLEDFSSAFPFPDWIEQEALRRLKEIVLEPEIGPEHHYLWLKMASRHG